MKDLKAICPGCNRLVADVDGLNMTLDRIICNNGEGDLCSDGNLYCLDCLMEHKDPCGKKNGE